VNVYTDSQVSINGIQTVKKYIKTNPRKVIKLTNHSTILEIVDEMERINTNITYHHVRSHQQIQTLNDECDTLAKDAVANPNTPTFQHSVNPKRILPKTKTEYLDKYPTTHCKQLAQNLLSEEVQTHISTKHPDIDFNTTFNNQHQLIPKQNTFDQTHFPLHTFITMIRNNNLPTMERLQKFKVTNTDKCPMCDQAETSTHMLQCRNTTQNLPDILQHFEDQLNHYINKELISKKPKNKHQIKHINQQASQFIKKYINPKHPAFMQTPFATGIIPTSLKQTIPNPNKTKDDKTTYCQHMKLLKIANYAWLTTLYDKIWKPRSRKAWDRRQITAFIKTSAAPAPPPSPSLPSAPSSPSMSEVSLDSLQQMWSPVPTNTQQSNSTNYQHPPPSPSMSEISLDSLQLMWSPAPTKIPNSQQSNSTNSQNTNTQTSPSNQRKRTRWNRIHLDFPEEDEDDIALPKRTRITPTYQQSTTPKRKRTQQPTTTSESEDEMEIPLTRKRKTHTALTVTTTNSLNTKQHPTTQPQPQLNPQKNTPKKPPDLAAGEDTTI
jgi:hypothetical protein